MSQKCSVCPRVMTPRGDDLFNTNIGIYYDKWPRRTSANLCDSDCDSETSVSLPNHMKMREFESAAGRPMEGTTKSIDATTRREALLRGNFTKQSICQQDS
jgi:hypothetical protein